MGVNATRSFEKIQKQIQQGKSNLKMAKGIRDGLKTQFFIWMLLRAHKLFLLPLS